MSYFNRPVAVSNGGTGLATITSGALLKGNGTLAVALAVAGTDYLSPTGSGSGLTSLNASNVSSGTLAVSYGGTGSNTLTSGSFLVGAGTSAVTFKVAPTGVVVGDTDTQTLTNKTLTSPALSAPAITGGATSTLTAIATTLTDGFLLQNTTAATAGVAIQYSPSLHYTAQSWTGSASTNMDFTSTLIPTSATASKLSWAFKTGAGSLTEKAFLDNAGNLSLQGALTLGTALTVGNGGTGATSITGLVKGNGTSAFTAATAGTDYLTPSGSGASLTSLNASSVSSGTLAIAYGGTGLSSTTAHYFFVGPTSGTGAPTWRAVAAGDLLSLDAFTAPAANVSFNSFRIVSLADPVSAQDGATKNYVDNKIAGISWKTPVLAATTGSNYTFAAGGTAASDTLTSMPTTLDGVTLLANSRVLVKDQSTTSQNGLYYVSTLGTGANGVWTRTTDSLSMTRDSAVFIEQGTSYQKTGWVINSTAATGPANSAGEPTILLDTDAIVWAQFTGAASITAGNALSQSGNTLNVVTDGATVSYGLSNSVSNSLFVSSNATAGQVLRSAGTTLTPATWGALDLSNANAVANSLPVNRGGTGSNTLTSGSFLVGAGTSAVTFKVAPTGTVVGTTDTQTLTNKTLDDTTTLIANTTTPTKLFRFDASAITAATTRVLTVPDISDTLVVLTATQTLTNKTLTSPTINSGAISGTFTGAATFSGAITFSNGTSPIISALIGPSTGQQHTVPAVTSDTLALLAATQTLTNKTVTAVTNGLTVGSTQLVVSNSGSVGGLVSIGSSAAGTAALTVAGPIATALVTKTTTYTIGDSDSTILADATTAAFTLTLPTSVGRTGRAITIKKVDSTANAVTIATTASQAIDGLTTQVINVQYDTLTLVSNGANWFII